MKIDIGVHFVRSLMKSRTAILRLGFPIFNYHIGAGGNLTIIVGGVSIRTPDSKLLLT